MANNTFDSIKIGLASPEQITEWSYGEVTKPETINYRSLKPEPDGLFCEKIFGPLKDWECSCGKYKRQVNKVIRCDKCGVETTRSNVRRERMGRIELATPVTHIWFLKGPPSKIGLILGIDHKKLERVVYFSAYVILDPGQTGRAKGEVIDSVELAQIREYHYDDEQFRVGMGAQAIQELLAGVDIEELCRSLREELDQVLGADYNSFAAKSSMNQKAAKILKRLDIAEAFRASKNKPEWMVLNVLPVIPPDIRPMVQLDGGRFAASDLNDLYRRVINRNRRLKELIANKACDIILNNEKRMLQEAVDALIDNGRRGKAVTGANNRPLKSLSDMLKGKQGRFRQNLLGKRVDYSGRSVIVVGPQLKIYQCGLPKEMALELFKPFVMKRLIETGLEKNNTTQKPNVKTAKKAVDRRDPEVWDALETVIKDHPVMLNRAPTLHRLGIQAFEPILVEGKAIKLHPLVCTAFNADFDGDQMAVHVPLSVEAQAEARFLMLASGNLLKPSDGKPVVNPTQDMLLGSYYLTLVMPGVKGEGKVFADTYEAQMAYDAGIIDLHALIKVKMTRELDGEQRSKIIETTLGKIIFNSAIPQDLGFVDRTNPDNMFRLEVEDLVNKKLLGKIVDRCITKHGTAVTSDVLDKIKENGYKFSTKSGITVAVCDATIPEAKKQILEQAEQKVDAVNRRYQRGLLSEKSRISTVTSTWEKCTEDVKEALLTHFKQNDRFNPIYMMLDSGARGNNSQLNQLAGMRGLISSTSGRTIEIPVRSNYREGLNVQEYFISSRGARKGLADTALRTADSGYLTRRLVDVAQEVIIRERDCHSTQGLEVCDVKEGRSLHEPLSERLSGRYLLENLVDEATGEIIMDNDHILTEADAQKVDDYLTAKAQRLFDERLAAAESDEEKKAVYDERDNLFDSVRRIKIRSLLTCKAEHGACMRCYGLNLATGKPVSIGEAVGVIAAQSIGEPGTQLTMRNFHTGGVASGSDITRGLPRVEEIFEARKPKMQAIICRSDGVVSFRTEKKTEIVVVTDSDGVEHKHPLEINAKKCVVDGQLVKKGDCLTEGSKKPSDLLEIMGESAVHDYIISQVQITYRSQGVDINDKHIEVIARQMMKKVQVIDPGDTALLRGSVVDRKQFVSENERVRLLGEQEGRQYAQATCNPLLLGISKAAVTTESFLSAASFQETSKVLADAAIRGKVDSLLGLKENVIIGKLIPSGTGMKCYSDVGYIDTQKVAESPFSVLTQAHSESHDEQEQ